ncbi:MAG TPA: cyclodeaminase/cyclohydrolase family protein [Bacteroidota bacterium]|nr:cyclodeaminase/cyclohydrolase family protein [Bacteroidota bacterium]
MSLVNRNLNALLEELASHSPAPGGGSVAALAGALGAALTSMVCRLTVGKKKYAEVEEEMKSVLAMSEKLRTAFTRLIDADTDAFNKVMEAYSLPKESDDQKALRNAAIQEATKEAALVPLECMKHGIDALALSRAVAQRGNLNSVSDAGVSALMIGAAIEAAALNVKINLTGITDMEFVEWKTQEVSSILKTGKDAAEEILLIVGEKISA